MAISFVSSGLAANGTTSIAVPHPASISAGNLLILIIAYKYLSASVVLPSGWTYLTSIYGQSGSDGIDTGNSNIVLLYKTAIGTETGNLSVSITSGNSAIGRMFNYSKAADKSWEVPFSYYSNPPAGYQPATNISGTFANVTTGTGNGPLPTDGNKILSGDLIIGSISVNTDAYTFSSQQITGTGLTVGTVTERQDSGTNSGQDCALMVFDQTVSTSTFDSSVNSLNYSFTSSGSATNAPSGGVLATILREVSASFTSSDPYGSRGYFGL